MEVSSDVNYWENISALEEFVDSLDLDSFSDDLNKVCSREDSPVILQSVFKRLSHSDSAQEVRYKISEAVLNNIEKKILTFKTANTLISILSSEVENLTPQHQVTLTKTCLNMIFTTPDTEGYNCWKDVLPKLLNVLSEKDGFDNDGTRVSGAEYKSDIVTTICSNNWPENLVARIASMFVEMTLTSEEHLRVVKKLCHHISTVKPEEIPPLAYQILQLTKNRHSIYLFIALHDYFNEKLYKSIGDDSSTLRFTPRDAADLKAIQVTEGTVLYYIYSAACSVGPQMIKDFLKILKETVNSPEFILQPFFISLLLTVSCISYNFEDDVSNLLKLAISRAITEKEKLSESAWLETILSFECDIENILDKVLQNGSSDRDKVLKGMVSLGFTLLNIPKTRGKELFCNQLWTTGNNILKKLVRNCSDVSSTVFQDLVNQISQVKDSAQYTDCLSRIIRETPLNLLDNAPAMIQLLDNICARSPGETGQKVVASLLPLTKMSHSLRDNLIIVLRKSLFPHDETCRKMAVSGFLELLKDLKITDLRSFSQSISQNYCGFTQIYSEALNTSSASHSNEGLCLEILSILREVFKHQCEVKIVFYRGIYDSVYANPELGNHVLDNLQNQLEKFYSFGEDLPPLDFKKTIECQGVDVIVQEPISHLILSIGLIAAKMTKSYESPRSQKLTGMLDSLCKRMAESDICHFTLDKDDIVDDELKNLAKQEEVKEVLGVYEALMGYTLCRPKEETVEHGQLLASLFRGYSRMSDYAKTLGKPDRKKDDKGKNKQKDDLAKEKKKEKNPAANFKLPPTVLNFKCCSRLLSLLNENSEEWASDPSITLIKGKRELHRYCLQAVLTLIKQAQNVAVCELSRNITTLRYLCQIGRVLFTRGLKRLLELKEFDVVAAASALECFSELLSLILSHFRPKFLEFLNSITEDVTDKTLEYQLKLILNSLLEQIEEILKDDFDEEQGKDDEKQEKIFMSYVISITSTFINQLPKKGTNNQQIVSKIKHMCREIKIKDPNTAKALLSLLLTTYMRLKASGGLMLDLALNLCSKMKLIDEEMSVEHHSPYAIINSHTTNACLMALCESVRAALSDIDWVTSRLRAELAALVFTSDKDKMIQKREILLEKERELCHHVNSYVKVVSTMCSIGVPPGIYSDAVLKELGSIYNTLTSLTKYFIVKVGKYNQPLQSTRFEKTVKLVDSDLSKNMYCFTEHVINYGGVDPKDRPGKGASKDSNALKNKILKETKNIPRVIYEKEQFYKFILQLSNKSKVNLVSQTKQSVARDYRISTKQVKKVLEKENIPTEETSMDDEEEDEAEEEEGSSQASVKRPRISDD